MNEIKNNKTIETINNFQPALKKSFDLTNPVEWIIMQVGDATIVKYAKADATDVAIPIITGSIPRSRTIGPKTATVAALLNKFVITEQRTTEKNQLTIVISETNN